MSWHLTSTVCVGTQTMLVIGALAAAELAPPARGPMLLFSTTGMTPGAILNRAMDAGALPVRAGPVPASIVVIGDRGRIVPATLSAGIIAFDAPGATCGEKTR